MGIIILIIIFIIEAALAAYCIKTKSNHPRSRNIVRISALIALALFLALSVIEWGVRYWILGAVLLIYAVIGVIGLVRKYEEKQEYKTGRIVRKAIVTTLILSLATAPAILLPQYKLPEATGSYKVATAEYSYVDGTRIETYTDSGIGREVNVAFWFPENGERTYPLIVFSHGMFGVKMSNELLFRELASHGYVVCSIDHPFQSFYTRNGNGDITLVDAGYMNEYNELSLTQDYARMYEIIDNVMEIRTSDMDFVLDTIIHQKTKGSEGPYHLVDRERIGVSGHSMGGSAALELGRHRQDVSAVMALESPFFGDILEVASQGFVFEDETYPIPMLNVYTDSTWQHIVSGLDPVYAQNTSYLSADGSNAYNVCFRGAKHLNLTDLVLFMPFMANMLDDGAGSIDKYDCLETLNALSLEFFDCHLKGKGVFAPEAMY